MTLHHVSKAIACVCTGCDFVDELSGRWVHGDLHLVGGAFVFNCVLRGVGEASWQYGEPRDSAMSITNERYFERRGIIVFPIEGSTMSETMLHHVQPEFRLA